MAELNLQQVHDLFIEIAQEAGRMMLAAVPSTDNSDQKQNSADLVTATDKAIESMVSQRLRSAYPSVLFIGEETYDASSTPLTDAPTFICDPIDGTTNFVHGFPYFCISLGLAIGQVPVVGVIYNPTLQELYTGIKGRGAFLTVRGGSANGGYKAQLPLRQPPEPLHDLSSCLVGLEWGTDRSGSNYEVKMRVFRSISAAKSEGGSMVQNIRSIGSAALHCASVAAGKEDLYWEGGVWPWDVCAGWCLVVEAGGRVVGGNEGDWDEAVHLADRKYVMVRGGERESQDRVVRELWDCMGGSKLRYD